MRFILVLFCLFAVLSSCDKVKKQRPEIIYKIPDPLREGIRKSKSKHAIITEFSENENGLLTERKFPRSVGYDNFGNINSYQFDRYIYNPNGFKIIDYDDQCNRNKYAIFYNQQNNSFVSKYYCLKKDEWDEAVDTSQVHGIFPGPKFNFDNQGNLIKTVLKSRINTTYIYDSLNRLVTIIDSLDRNGDDYDLPVRKEFIYNNEGKLSKVNELDRSNLITSAKVNNKGLIDTIYYFDKQRKIEKLEVYEYKY